MVPTVDRPTPPAALLAPPTEADLLAREAQHQAYIELVLPQGHALGLTALQQFPPALQRQLLLQGLLLTDVGTAHANGWWQEALRLQVELQRLEADIRYQAWQHGLLVDYGQEVGRKLGQHQVEVGMTLRHVLASYGVPAQGMLLDAEDTGLMYLNYGSEATGSRFELREGIVTRAVLGRPELPAYVLDNTRELGG